MFSFYNLSTIERDYAFLPCGAPRDSARHVYLAYIIAQFPPTKLNMLYRSSKRTKLNVYS